MLLIDGMHRIRPRLPRTSYVGRQRFLLTFCCHERQPLFSHTGVVASTRDQILREAGRAGVAILAYCFLPDHVHLVVAGLDDSTDLGRFVKLAKQYTGYTYKQRTGALLWQSGWHDRVIWPSSDIIDSLRYVIENPVRAGLVRSPEAYPHTGSATMSREQLFRTCGLSPTG